MAAAIRETRLFTVRMWLGEANEDGAKPEWRGKVQALPEGEAYYFRDWLGLIMHLEAMLNAGQVDRPTFDSYTRG